MTSMAECKKKCLSCVVCSNSIHKCSHESVQYQKKNQNTVGLFPTCYFMEVLGKKKIWQNKEIKTTVFFTFLRPLLFFQVHEEMYFESDGGGSVHDYDIFCKVSTATTTN